MSAQNDTVNIAITSEVARLIEQLDSRHYESASEVIREAVTLLATRHNRAALPDALVSEIRLGAESGSTSEWSDEEIRNALKVK